MLQAGKWRVRVPMTSLDFSIDLIIDPASNRNEYQESSFGVKGGRRIRLDNFTAICEPIV
jgi:hypothetical protein